MSNAKTKRLNESFRPVANYGTADDFHKLIIPQNTTANLAQITPKEIGSIAYDTTLNSVVVNNGTGFVAAGGGSGTVTSVATSTGLTGGPVTTTGTIALANTTVTPASYTSANITVDQQGRITAASNGSSGANNALSNLTSPTAINQNLTFSSALTLAEITTPATTGSTNSNELLILTGNVVDGNSGVLDIISGTPSGNGSSGAVNIESGSTAGTGDSGVVSISGGTATFSGASVGGVAISGGNSNAGTAGGITVISGSDTTTNGGSNTQGILQLGSDGQILVTSSLGALDFPTFTPTMAFYDAQQGHFSGLKAASSLSTSQTWTLPSTQGAAGQVLTNSDGGAGTLTWSPGIHSFTSAASISGGASQTLTVTGLASTDTVVAVSQKTAGSAVLPLLGWTTVANNALTVQWSANPGAGAVVVVTVLR